MQSNQLKRGCNTLEHGLYRREGEFATEHAQLTRSREATLDLVRKRLAGFKTGLKNIEHRLKGIRELKNGRYDTTDLRKFLESFESKLTTYKCSMRAEFDSLQNEESKIESEVGAMVTKIEVWESETASAKPAAAEAALVSEKAQRARNQDRYAKHIELQGKIGAIDRQIAALGGVYGGWDSWDHDAFVRAWVQSTSASPSHGLSESQRRALMKRLVATVPVKTEEELEAHVEWFLKHQELTWQKKELLDQWKESRQQEQSRKYKSSLEEELDQEERSEKLKNKPMSVFVTAESRAAEKQRIAAWKLEKEQEEQNKAERERAARVLQQQKLDDDKRKRQAIQRAKLESWKKEEEESKKVASKAVASTAVRVTDAQLAARQRRDRELTSLQLARKERAQDRASARETKVRELAKALVVEGQGPVEASKDPSRLLSGTKAFNQNKYELESLSDAQRRRAEASAHSSIIAGHGRDLHGVGRSPAAWLGRK